MILDDIHVRPVNHKDITRLFELAKRSLYEKGIENIRDDILMLGLKNNLVKKYKNIDLGLYKLNTLIGFAFIELQKPMYLAKAIATVDTIYILEEFRNIENYQKLLNTTLPTLAKAEITTIKTSDEWTLSNDCEILKAAIITLGKPKIIYDLEI
jgi:hypothetical protein